jgi:hypothetical protein
LHQGVLFEANKVWEALQLTIFAKVGHSAVDQSKVNWPYITRTEVSWWPDPGKWCKGPKL